MQLSWKEIKVVHTYNELLDVVLNRTQRKTPTVIRAGFKITRIRAFYMRKVKYTSEGFVEKLDEIINKFPKIDDLHPFQKDLMDTLYEKNHYKISLSSVSGVKNLIEKIARDYSRLLKFGQSLYQCKQLKIAALGRMATMIKKLKDPLIYLEQVRQHLSRLPSIDPTTRTLLICGYPNVGKSSFLRCITKANVEVQPYAFTTKSLYVGHFDYKYLRFQAIDTPGILDRPTDEMNNIEMQSVYAIAHLKSTILYFMDLSEQCGYSIDSQVKLFHSLKPLFANKSVLIVFNKSDITKSLDLSTEKREQLKSLMELDEVEKVEVSCHDEENIAHVRDLACEKLLLIRSEQKLKNRALELKVLNKIHVGQPVARDNVSRDYYVPDLSGFRKYDSSDPNRLVLSKDKEILAGGPGVYNINLKENYFLDDDDWKNDHIPETINGKNIYDYYDPEISKKLKDLEDEEERLEQEGFYDSDLSSFSDETKDLKSKATWIRNKHKVMRLEAFNRKSLRTKPLLSRKSIKRPRSLLTSHLSSMGISVPKLPSISNPSILAPTATAFSGLLPNKLPQHKLSRLDRLNDGVKDSASRNLSHKLLHSARKKRNLLAKRGEADHHVPNSMPKHLFSGKRGIGSARSR